MTLPGYRSICVVLAVAVFSTSFANYSLRWGVRPLDWIFILLLLSAPVIAGALLFDQIVLPPLVIWCAGFLAISIVWFFPSPQDELAVKEMRTRFLSVIFLILMSMLFARPREQRIARGGIALATVVSASLNIYELFHPLTFSKIPGRSSGLFDNVNQSGAALVLGLIVGFDAVKPRWRFLYVGILAAGIVSTFSRSAMMAFVLVLIYLALRDGIRTGLVLRMIGILAVATAVIFSPAMGRLEESLQRRGVLTLDVVERLSFFTSGRLGDRSASDRETVAAEAWRAFTERPLRGWGVAASQRFDDMGLGTHNIYLAMLVDHGILGLLIAPSMVVFALWGASGEFLRKTGVPFFCFFLFWGMFSHNILEERYILLVVALVAATTASDARAVRAAEQRGRPVIEPHAIGATA